MNALHASILRTLVRPSARLALSAAFAGAAFAGATMAGCSGADPSSGSDPGKASEEVGTANEDLVANCPYTSPAINVPTEIVISDLSVVNDACRTSVTAPVPPPRPPPGGPPPPPPPPACAAGTLGAWTFAHLMTEMAGNNTPGAFVAQWLHSWEVPTTVNGIPLQPRGGVRPQLIDPWLVASGCAAGSPIVGPGLCPLNLAVAPFRLLAIVNRVDLGGVVGTGAPGEGRLVFGAYDIQNGAPIPFTVNFEYNLPTSASTFGWASAFYALGSNPFPSAAYNTALQAITDGFIAAGAQPGNPNLGNAIGQVRTNEIAFGPVWEMRETVLTLGDTTNDELLLPTTVKQTPESSFNNTPPLDAWLTSSGVQAEILAQTDTIPASFNGAPLLGSSALTPPGFFWQGPLSPPARSLFGFGTCNGCHTAETGTNFLHIGPRPQNQPAPLSPFLGVSAAPAPGGSLPAQVWTFVDPTGARQSYNEPWRRACEMKRLLAGNPTPVTLPNGAPY